MRKAETEFQGLTDHMEVVVEVTLTCGLCGKSEAKESLSVHGKDSLAIDFWEDGWREMTGETDDEPLAEVWCPECLK